MARFNLDEYATVEERLEKFWNDHPNGAVITDIVKHEGDVCIFKALIFFERGAELVATGFAEEIRDASPVNKTSFVENAETSAIGRALAACGYQMKKRPSREEMEKVERRNSLGSAAAKPVQVEDPKALVSEEFRETFTKACEKIGLIPLQVTATAGLDWTELYNHEKDKLRATFKLMKEGMIASGELES
jgi:hypothetical protein